MTFVLGFGLVVAGVLTGFVALSLAGVKGPGIPAPIKFACVASLITSAVTTVVVGAYVLATGSAPLG